MIGALLINLGTPDAPQTPEVRRYLREFLMDPRVIDIHPIARWFLVQGIIAPFRAPKSAKAYQKIWGPEGSPLMTHTLQLAAGVQAQLGDEYKVEVGMRYGKPSIPHALEKLAAHGVKEIRALPLYPQYAASSTGTAEDAVLGFIRGKKDFPEVRFIPPFFDHSGFIQSWVDIAGPLLEGFRPDHYLFSFHGLPERHILKEDISKKHCLQTPDCCERMVPANGMCYRAHCFQSAKGIAAALQIPRENFSIAFQSRLGRTPWIQPFTDLLIREFPDRGIRRLAVFCPSFVADCLETLEEIGIRGKSDFIAAGGEELLLIPSLNSNPTWTRTVAQMLRG